MIQKGGVAKTTPSPVAKAATPKASTPRGVISSPVPRVKEVSTSVSNTPRNEGLKNENNYDMTIVAWLKEPHRGYAHKDFGICRSISEFERLGQLGEGTYGVVYKALDSNKKEVVALKKIRMERETDGVPITALREVTILKSIHHPNIIRLNEVAVDERQDRMYLVFEYAEHDLGYLLDHTRSPFTESDIKTLSLQLLKGVAYLHDHFIIHRDLKLSNLLYNNKGQLKLADFGLARTYGTPLRSYTPKVVTLWYRAPELLLGAKTYGVSLDMWGVGCIIGELLYKSPILPGQTEIEQLKLIFSLLGSPNDKIWPGYSELPNFKTVASLQNMPYSNLAHKFNFLSIEGLDLLNRLLTYDPTKRLTAHEAEEHPYFKAKPLPKLENLMPTFPEKPSQNVEKRKRDDHQTTTTAAPPAKKENWHSIWKPN